MCNSWTARTSKNVEVNSDFNTKDKVTRTYVWRQHSSSMCNVRSKNNNATFDGVECARVELQVKHWEQRGTVNKNGEARHVHIEVQSHTVVQSKAMYNVELLTKRWSKARTYWSAKSYSGGKRGNAQCGTVNKMVKQGTYILKCKVTQWWKARQCAMWYWKQNGEARHIHIEVQSHTVVQSEVMWNC